MRYWLREFAGWALVALGLLDFFEVYQMLVRERQPSWFLEAGPLTVIGIFVFRGGIHLLKVAAAADICLQVQRQLEQAGEAKPRTTQIRRW